MESKFHLPKKWKLYLMMVMFLFVSIFSMFLFLLKTSYVNVQALRLAKENGEVEEKLGSPIKAAFLIGGRITWTGPSGEAYVFSPISGPKGEGVVEGHAVKKEWKWEFDELYVILKDEQKINLLK